MSALNRPAAQAMLAVGAHACTDITGFGLLGHLRELAAGSGVDVSLSTRAVPILDSARRLAAGGAVPGGTIDNLAHVEPHVTFVPTIARLDQLLLADAQTSGGLLIALPEERAEPLHDELRAEGVSAAATIGRVTGQGSGRIRVEE
jgi:selenide,water dikinase